MKKYFIGIDVSKETVDVSFVESDFQQQPEYLAQYPPDFVIAYPKICR